MSLGRTVETRRRNAIRILVWRLLDPSSVSDDDLVAVARWLWESTRHGDRTARRFNLAKEMASHGISTDDLAARFGVTPRAVRYWRSGERLPSRDTIDRLAELFGLSPRRLAAGLRAGHRRHRRRASIPRGPDRGTG